MTEVSSKKSFRLNDEIVEFLMNSLDLFKASKILQNLGKKVASVVLGILGVK